MNLRDNTIADLDDTEATLSSTLGRQARDRGRGTVATRLLTIVGEIDSFLSRFAAPYLSLVEVAVHGGSLGGRAGLAPLVLTSTADPNGHGRSGRRA